MIPQNYRFEIDTCYQNNSYVLWPWLSSKPIGLGPRLVFTHPKSLDIFWTLKSGRGSPLEGPRVCIKGS